MSAGPTTDEVGRPTLNYAPSELAEVLRKPCRPAGGCTGSRWQHRVWDVEAENELVEHVTAPAGGRLVPGGNVIDPLGVSTLNTEQARKAGADGHRNVGVSYVGQDFYILGVTDWAYP